MKRLLCIVVLFMLIFFRGTEAAMVRVQGMGADKEGALKDAMRLAVEKVIGTYVDSKTLVEQASVVEDKILTKAQGFVTDIQILQQKRKDGNYWIDANINVNENPNSELRNRIEMVMLLGDPRMSVIVTYYSDDNSGRREKYPKMCETSMNNELLKNGFNHVINVDQLFNIKRINRRMAADGRYLLPCKQIDYLVIGKLDFMTDGVRLPAYNEMTGSNPVSSYETGLKRVQAEMDVEILNGATGEIAGNYRVTACGVHNSTYGAEYNAINEVGKEAAAKLRSVLSGKAANVTAGVQLIVITDNYRKFEKVIGALRNMGEVKGLGGLNFTENRGQVYVETDLKPQTIFRILREKIELNIRMQTINNNVAEFVIN